ncbi:TPA: hypothetical protein DCF80_00645 [Candidatus Saccharibacteria bacterium]|nr:hypothetical protein [Candidatus Saccharibacteria bacterium]
MRLEVRRALTGTPGLGDEIDVKLQDGRTLKLTYQPHESFDHYVWMVQEGGEPPEELRSEFELLTRRLSLKVGEDWIASYLNPDYDIAEGMPLFMVIVPRGNMSDWPRRYTVSKVEQLSL